MRKTELEYLREHAATRPDGVAYGERIDGRWRDVTWREYDVHIRRCARALLALDVEAAHRGDRFLLRWVAPLSDS